MPYKPEPGVEIFGPGESLPTAIDRGPVGRPAQQDDLNWLNKGVVGRWDGRRQTKAVRGQIALIEAATEYNTQSAAYQHSRQALVLAHQEAALLPLKLEAQRQQLHEQLLHGQFRLDSMLQEHQREAELGAIEHKTARLHAKADKVEAEARLKEAKRALKDAGKKKHNGAHVDDTPETFRRYRATETEVHRNRSAADAEIAAIFDRVRAEGRTALTDEEVEEVDALRSAASAAESEVRRRAASDF